MLTTLDGLINEKNITVERRLQINVLHGSASEKLKILNVLNKQDRANSHTLLHNLTPQSIKIEKIGNNHQFFQPCEPYTVLLPKNVHVVLQTLAKSPLKLVETKINDRFHLRNSDIGVRKCSTEMINELNRVYSLCVDENSEPVTISALSDNISNASLAQFGLSADTPKRRSLHQAKMLLLKSVIEESIKTGFPALATLAQKAGMTVSTIKRHFKNEFGISMYQYYLQQKMEIARKLLEEDRLSVNDTAERLRYASVSNFIETFRNYHGRTPGSMKG